MDFVSIGQIAGWPNRKEFVFLHCDMAMIFLILRRKITKY